MKYNVLDVHKELMNCGDVFSHNIDCTHELCIICEVDNDDNKYYYISYRWIDDKEITHQRNYSITYDVWEAVAWLNKILVDLAYVVANIEGYLGEDIDGFINQLNGNVSYDPIPKPDIMEDCMRSGPSIHTPTYLEIMKPLGVELGIRSLVGSHDTIVCNLTNKTSLILRREYISAIGVYYTIHLKPFVKGATLEEHLVIYLLDIVEAIKAFNVAISVYKPLSNLTVDYAVQGSEIVNNILNLK